MERGKLSICFAGLRIEPLVPIPGAQVINSLGYSLDKTYIQLMWNGGHWGGKRWQIKQGQLFTLHDPP